jgi:hypothetical protein|nr:MAG TPA: hypothetical protein [Caudoviricetes sp.]
MTRKDIKKMLRQQIDGLYSKSLVFSTGSDESALIPLLAGKVETYSSFFEGGTAVSVTPNPLNRKSVIVGAKTPTGRVSTMITIPHVKQSYMYQNFVADFKNNLNASFDDTTKCDYVTLKFDRL